MRPIDRCRILAGLPALFALGCSEPTVTPAPKEPAVHLSTENPDSNAPAVAAFFRRTCLETSGDPGAFAAALEAAGWEHEQVQAAVDPMPIAAWRLDHGEIVRSALAPAPGVNFVDCELTLEPEVAPSLERMRDALRPMLSHASLRVISAGPPEAKWQWRPTPREERDVRIRIVPARATANRAPARPGLAIRLATSDAPPAPALPAETGAGAGTGNVQ
jgi:hypothetical protein